jgi:hypothetical protein
LLVKLDWESVAGRVGQEFVGPVGVEVEVSVVVRVVVIVRAVGVAREVVWVRSRRDMRVVVVVVVEGLPPGQRGRDVGRGAMCGFR